MSQVQEIVRCYKCETFQGKLKGQFTTFGELKGTVYNIWRN